MEPEELLRAARAHRRRSVDDALRYLHLLQQSPSEPHLEEDAGEALRSESAEVVLSACAALNAKAALRPLDAPPLEAGPGVRAAMAAAALLDEGVGDRRIEAYLWINRANGLRSAGPEHDGEARAAYEEALRRMPENGHWWFDLAVLHKWRGRFAEGFDCLLRARARLGVTRPIQWNLAICGTACGEGDVAAATWRELGFAHAVLHPQSGLPSVPDLPPMRIRVLSRRQGYAFETEHEVGFEALWVAPISPCHGVVQSPSFRDAPVDYGDIVLWDGAPAAVDGGVPTFPVLEILHPGSELRCPFVLLADGEQVLALREQLGEGVRLFLQGEPPSESALRYGTLVATAGLSAEEVERRWSQSRLRAAIPTLYERMGNAKRAGQEHQAWRGVERAARKGNR